MTSRGEDRVAAHREAQGFTPVGSSAPSRQEPATPEEVMDAIRDEVDEAYGSQREESIVSSPSNPPKWKQWQSDHKPKRGEQSCPKRNLGQGYAELLEKEWTERGKMAERLRLNDSSECEKEEQLAPIAGRLERRRGVIRARRLGRRGMRDGFSHVERLSAFLSYGRVFLLFHLYCTCVSERLSSARAIWEMGDGNCGQAG